MLRKRPACVVHGTPLANGGLVFPELKGKNQLLGIFLPLVVLTADLSYLYNIYSVAAMNPSKSSKKSKKRGADEVPQAEPRRDKKVGSGPPATSSHQASLVPFANSIMMSVREPAKAMDPIEHLQRSYAQAAQV